MNALPPFLNLIVFKNCLESLFVVELLQRKGNVDHVDQKAINRNLKAGEFFNENIRGPVVRFSMNAAFARRRPRVQIPPGPHLSMLELKFGQVLCV
jgi:hypothetical protein